MAISSFGSTAVGFAASGLIASQFSIDWAFYIDGATFLFSAGSIALLHLVPFKTEEDTKVSTIIRNMKSGFQFLLGKPILRSMFIMFPVVGISFGLWNTLLLPFARQALGATEFEYGLQEALTSVGFVVGSLLMARASDRLHEGQWMTVSLLTMGVINAIYSQLASIPIAILFVTLSGFSNAPYTIVRGIIIQRNTPREMRGRVSSAFFVTRDVSFLLGMVLAGLADIVGVREMTLLSAAMVLFPGVLAIFLPGLGQPATEWRRALHLLRNAAAAPRPTAIRAATLADFDRLAPRVSALSSLTAVERSDLIKESKVIEAPPGTTILSVGEKGDAVYFVLSGQAVAGIQSDGNYRSLETMGAGDFFGEIAALTGGERTANVVAIESATLLQVPSTTFRRLMHVAQLRQVVRSKLYERLHRTNLGDLPRFSGFDQEMLRELRTESKPAT
jgi:CRP-like cAMP-binding protein